MHTHTNRVLTMLALCMFVFLPGRVSARDDGHFADSPLKPWFDRLASGKGLCCSFADGVSVDVADDGPGTLTVTVGQGGGTGLAGLCERARLLGGCLEAGPGAQGGFVVHAFLPDGIR